MKYLWLTLLGYRFRGYLRHPDGTAQMLSVKVHPFGFVWRK